MFRVGIWLVVMVVLGSTLVKSHEESGKWSCESDSEARVAAEFRPGLVTLDGHADDWKGVDGFDFPLLPAVDPDDDHKYSGGKMTLKVQFHLINESIHTHTLIHIYVLQFSCVGDV